MAMIATNTTPAAFANGLFARVGQALYTMTMQGYRTSQAFKAARYASELSQMTDEQLAARGLKRHELVQHAFAGVPLV